MSRRSILKTIGGTAMISLTSSVIASGSGKAGDKLKGNIRHSVCKWCYGNIPLEKLCESVKAMGMESIELLGPADWPTLKKYGLTCAMANGAEISLERGFNDLSAHEELVKRYEEMIPKVAAAGLKNLICFSGNRNGMSDEQGLENCAKGLQRLMPTAEKHKVTLVMELLNSKVNHKDYQCDHTKWGAELCQKVNSDNFKLLYDIYHMQIMEGDVIATIKKYHPYIAHYHTGGVPGRAEIDDSQELYYPAIMKAIVETGFKGFVAQEFVPRSSDPIASLKKCVNICDV